LISLPAAAQKVELKPVEWGVYFRNIERLKLFAGRSNVRFEDVANTMDTVLFFQNKFYVQLTDTTKKNERNKPR